MKQSGKSAHVELGNACARVMAVRKPFFGRAAGMLTKLLDRGIDAHTLAAELVITPGQLEAYRSGRILMPLDRQLCLALFVLESVPSLAKECRALRAQVVAAASFHAAVTTTHNGPPTRSYNFPARKFAQRET